MALPPLKKIKNSNLSLDYLARLYNQFVNDIIYLLNRRLTFKENFDGIIHTVELDGVFPKKVAWPRPQQPTALWPVAIKRSDKTATALSAGFIIEWEYVGGQVSIINTPGLTSSTSDKYQLTFIAVTG